MRNFKSAFTRQIAEAIEIRLRTRRGDFLLNNKQEFLRCVLPELETTMADKIVGKQKALEIRKEVEKRGDRDDDTEKKEKPGHKRMNKEGDGDRPGKRQRLCLKQDGQRGKSRNSLISDYFEKVK